jgi:lipopolysaccharide/colanic/teichoic acid biosynthesis glycosyltransferase
VHTVGSSGTGVQRTALNRTFYRLYGKRCLDLLATIPGLLLLSPFLVLVAVAVKLESTGPVLFKQTRVGQHGKLFLMFKFRSMKQRKDSGSKLTPAGDPRITRLGAWLRRTKVDELPQLINVVLGDMSLVGPRPEVPDFVQHYNDVQCGVLQAQPGITGPSANVYEEELLANQEDREEFYIKAVMPAKLVIDLAYCENISFRSDLQILYRTFAKLLIRVYELYKRIPHPQT